MGKAVINPSLPKPYLSLIGLHCKKVHADLRFAVFTEEKNTPARRELKCQPAVSFAVIDLPGL